MKRARDSDEDKSPDSKETKFDENENQASGASDGVEDTVCFFDRLPDHLVVRIFQELENLKDIALILPQVCKRWQLLVLHENLWKDVFVSYGSHMPEYRKNIFFKYLQMAPKLGGITFELSYKDGRDDFSKRIIRKCPQEVSVLHFIYDNFPPEALFTLLCKYKHSIEKLIITDTFTPYVDEDVKRLWKDIQSLTKLKHLVVDGAALFYFKASFRKAAPCWKTFNILDVKDSSYEDMNTVQRLISVHSNWTEVYLATTSSTIFRGEVKALAKCTKLESVQVPFCREFKFLEKCEKLDSIIIDCVVETSIEVPAVIPLLSKKSTFPLLKKVKVVGGGSEYAPLLKALVDEREVTLLNCVSCEISSDDLYDVLTKLQGLQRLYFHEMSVHSVSAVVKGMQNNKLPQLEQFIVNECYCEEESKLCLKLLVKQLDQYPKLKVTTANTVCSCAS